MIANYKHGIFMCVCMHTSIYAYMYTHIYEYMFVFGLCIDTATNM